MTTVFEWGNIYDTNKEFRYHGKKGFAGTGIRFIICDK